MIDIDSFCLYNKNYQTFGYCGKTNEPRRLGGINEEVYCINGDFDVEKVTIEFIDVTDYEYNFEFDFNDLDNAKQEGVYEYGSYDDDDKDGNLIETIDSRDYFKALTISLSGKGNSEVTVAEVSVTCNSPFIYNEDTGTFSLVDKIVFKPIIKN